jgi:hypothetical protein
MKKVLSILVTFVFLQVQSWALSGGPTYGALNNSVSGTYAGVMLGAVGTNGLGLFQIGMPDAGLGSGTFAFFAGGGAFFGTMVALADGEKNSMSGIFKGQLTVQISGTAGGGGAVTTTVVPVALIGGQFLATIKGTSTGTTQIGVGARLIGTAAATVTASNTPDPFGTGPIALPPGIVVGDTTLTIDGFQQSSAVTGQVSLSSLTGTTPAGG